MCDVVKSFDERGSGKEMEEQRVGTKGKREGQKEEEEEEEEKLWEIQS